MNHIQDSKRVPRAKQSEVVIQDLINSRCARHDGCPWRSVYRTILFYSITITIMRVVVEVAFKAPPKSKSFHLISLIPRPIYQRIPTEHADVDAT